MRTARRLLIVLLAVILLVLVSFLTSLFGPGPGPDPEPAGSPPPSSLPAGRILAADGGAAPHGTTVAAIGPGRRVEAAVAPDGTFRFAEATEGAVEYEVAAGSLLVRHPVGPGTSEIRLPGAVDLAGRVVAVDTGEPVPGARVACAGRSVSTDDRGHFELAGIPVPDANVPGISVSAAGFEALLLDTTEARAWDDLFLRLLRR